MRACFAFLPDVLTATRLLGWCRSQLDEERGAPSDAVARENGLSEVSIEGFQGNRVSHRVGGKMEESVPMNEPERVNGLAG